MAENKTAPQEAKNPSSKKKYVRRRLCALAIIFLLIWWFNNFTLKVNEFTIRSAKIQNKVRVAVISDMHASGFGINEEKIADKIIKAKPDVLFVLGDMYTMDSTEKLMQKPVDLAKKVVDAGVPVYFITGEHDTKKFYIDAMTEAGAVPVNYECRYIELNGNTIQLIGIDNVYYSDTFDLNNAFVRDDSCYTILLAHIPNYEKFAMFGAELTLCADTHGGMIQLPFDKGPVYSDGNWFPQFDRPDETVYDKGAFEYSGGTMFITSGLGNYPVAARLNNRPEIAVLDLIPE